IQRLIGPGYLVSPMRAPAELAAGAGARGRSLLHVLPRDVERRAGQEGLAGHRQAGQLPALVHRMAGLEDTRLIDAAELDDLPDVDAHPEPGSPSLPRMPAHGVVQGEGRVDRGVRRLEVDLVCAGCLRPERAPPTPERVLKQVVERLDDVADPGHLAA